MEALIPFFQDIQPWQRSLILAGGLLFFWVLEGVIPLFRLRYRKFRHAGLNLFFTFTTLIINFLFAFSVEDIRSLHYGIDTYPKEEEHNRMGNLLQIPFREYRPPAGAKFNEDEGG